MIRDGVVGPDSPYPPAHFPLGIAGLSECIASEIRTGHTGRVSSAKTAGQALREQIDESLPPGVVWTKLELVTLARIEVMADRLAAIAKRADDAIADPDASASKITMLANAVRHLEVSMHAMMKTLDPTMETAKSMKHVYAANKRWHGGAG